MNPLSRLRSLLPASAMHVGALSLGTVAGQAVLLLASPLLTRLYSPSEYGAFSVIMGISTLVASLCALSYPVAIPLAATRRDASELVWMTLLASLLIAPVGTIVAEWVMARQDDPTLFTPMSSILVAATSILLALWAGMRAFAAREDQFRSISMSGIADSGFQAGSQLGFGYLQLGGAGLAGGYLAGKVAAVGLLVWGSRSQLMAPRRPWRAARQWVKYSLWVTPTTLLNQASVTAIAPYVASLYGAVVAGQISLASRMLAVPSALIGQAIGTVLFPKIARMAREGRSSLLAIQSVASALASIALPVFAITALMGPELFSLVFGSEWRDAGVAAAILSPWLALSLVSSPISSVATVRERLGQLLALGLLEASLRFGALSLGAGSNNWRLALAAYSAAGCLISAYTIAWVLRLCGGSLWTWLGSWPKANWAFLVAVCVLAGVKPMVAPVPFLVGASVLCLLGALAGARSLRNAVRQ